MMFVNHATGESATLREECGEIFLESMSDPENWVGYADHHEALKILFSMVARVQHAGDGEK